MIRGTRRACTSCGRRLASFGVLEWAELFATLSETLGGLWAGTSASGGIRGHLDYRRRLGGSPEVLNPEASGLGSLGARLGPASWDPRRCLIFGRPEATSISGSTEGAVITKKTGSLERTQRRGLGSNVRTRD